jgi:Ca2+-binding RTX toxin-like protein
MGTAHVTVEGAECGLDVYFDYQMVGGDGNGQITGGTFGDELWGGPGNDTLNGGLGDDIMSGRSLTISNLILLEPTFILS